MGVWPHASPTPTWRHPWCADDCPFHPRIEVHRYALPGEVPVVPDERIEVPRLAISIRQPWAFLIAHGPKDVENRTWSTEVRGDVLIHASKGMTRAEYADAREFCEDMGANGPALPAPEQLERGGIVGMARITDCLAKRTTLLDAPGESPWHAHGQYGFVLSDRRKLKLIPCSGLLGFWRVPEHIRDAVRAQLEESA